MPLDNELKSIAQAYLSMHEKKKTVDEEEKIDCPKCEGTGKVDGDDCSHCDGKGYHMKDDDDDDDDDKEVNEANFDKNFSKRIAAKAKGGKGAEYMSKKAAQAKQFGAKQDPGAAKKGLGPAVVDRQKAYQKARKKGLPPGQRVPYSGTYNKDKRRLPEQSELDEAMTSAIEINDFFSMSDDQKEKLVKLAKKHNLKTPIEKRGRKNIAVVDGDKKTMQKFENELKRMGIKFTATESVEEEKKMMDPVNKKAVKKDFDDRKDKDIDNDGDVDDSDEYLHKRRKAISKSMKKEDMQWDWESILEWNESDIDALIDALDGDDLQSFVNEFEAIQEAATAQMKPKPEDQEKLEPRAAAEKDWASKTTKDKKVVDRPDAVKQDGSDKVKVASPRNGDNMTGERPMKTLKDIRK